MRMSTVIDRAEVRRLLEQGGSQLIEVLPWDEYELEHIAGAVNIPLKELSRAAVRTLDRERPVIVYCNDYT